MPQFSDEYFRDLPPRDRRYDTPVADQLVFSVFPNGVKAWVHVYPLDDYVRRRTMGLFPEMGLAAARAALEQSRRIAEVDAQQVRPTGKARKPPTRMIFAVVAAAALSSVLTFLLVRPEPPGELSPPPERPAAVPEPAPVTDDGRPTGADSASMADPATDEAPGRAPADPPRAHDADMAGMPGPSPDRQGATGESADGSAAEDAGDEDADTGTSDNSGDNAGGDAGAGPGGGPAAGVDAGRDAAGTPHGEQGTPQEQRSEPEQATDAEPRVPPAQTAPGSDEQAATDGDAGPVSRVVIASAVVDREPVDELPDSLELPVEGSLTVFFFTELRGLEGRNVLHRWTRDGETVATIPFKIGDGARWRIYSSKEIGLDDVGSWSVAVVNGDGVPLASRDFAVRAPALPITEAES